MEIVRGHMSLVPHSWREGEVVYPCSRPLMLHTQMFLLAHPCFQKRVLSLPEANNIVRIMTRSLNFTVSRQEPDMGETTRIVGGPVSSEIQSEGLDIWATC